MYSGTTFKLGLWRLKSHCSCPQKITVFWFCSCRLNSWIIGVIWDSLGVPSLWTGMVVIIVTWNIVISLVLLLVGDTGPLAICKLPSQIFLGGPRGVFYMLANKSISFGCCQLPPFGATVELPSVVCASELHGCLWQIWGEWLPPLCFPLWGSETFISDDLSDKTS